jgi:pSer/pThr/pTyr-binding forkhead associated (FHA) protein
MHLPSERRPIDPAPMKQVLSDEWYDPCVLHAIGNLLALDTIIHSDRAGSQVAAKKSNNNGSVAVARKSKPAKNATLTIQNGCFAGLVIPLKKARMLLGRDVDCDICLDDSLVSDEHAAISRNGGDFVLEDLNSRNGERINRRKLRNGEMVSIGNFQLKFSRK